MAEHRIVVPGVVGSSPITHPIKRKDTERYPFFLYFVRNRGLEQSNATRTSIAYWGGSPRSEFVIPMIAGGNHTEIHLTERYLDETSPITHPSKP